MATLKFLKKNKQCSYGIFTKNELRENQLRQNFNDAMMLKVLLKTGRNDFKIALTVTQ